MSFLVATPEVLTSAAAGLESLGATLNAAHAAAAAPTTGILAAGADEVSGAVSSLFVEYGQVYQALSTQAASFHQQFVQLLNGGAVHYALTEAANTNPLQIIEQDLLGAINTPSQLLTGRPLIGNGANGAPNTGANGVNAGWLFGNGGNGASAAAGDNGGNGGAGGFFGGAGGAGGAGGQNATGGSGGAGGSSVASVARAAREASATPPPPAGRAAMVAPAACSPLAVSAGAAGPVLPGPEVRVGRAAPAVLCPRSSRRHWRLQFRWRRARRQRWDGRMVWCRRRRWCRRCNGLRVGWSRRDRRKWRPVGGLWRWWRWRKWFPIRKRRWRGRRWRQWRDPGWKRRARWGRRLRRILR